MDELRRAIHRDKQRILNLERKHQKAEIESFLRILKDPDCRLKVYLEIPLDSEKTSYATVCSAVLGEPDPSLRSALGDAARRIADELSNPLAP